MKQVVTDSVPGVKKPPQPSTLTPATFGSLARYEIILRVHWKFAAGILEAMFKVYSFRKNYAAVQETGSNFAELHKGEPYDEVLAQVFLAIMVASLLLTFSHTMYTKRRQIALSKGWRVSSGLCSLTSWIQVWYLSFYVAEAIVTEKELWDCHFILSVAWIRIVEWFRLISADW